MHCIRVASSPSTLHHLGPKEAQALSSCRLCVFSAVTASFHHWQFGSLKQLPDSCSQNTLNQGVLMQNMKLCETHTVVLYMTMNFIFYVV